MRVFAALVAAAGERPVSRAGPAAIIAIWIAGAALVGWLLWKRCG